MLAILFVSFMWEIAKNLWANWGTSSFWISSFFAAIVGVLAWWGIGLMAYLSTPRTAAPASASPTPSMQQSATASGGSTITQNQASRDIVINTLAPTQTIPGTNVTERQVRDVFPFGYVIFSAREGKWTYSPLPSDKMQYTANWEEVSIMPDFEKDAVTWSIPNVDSTNTRVQVIGNRITCAVPLNPKQISLVRGVVIANQPMLHVATLSDNQRFPVFVLGFRIPSEEELKSGSFAAPWAH